MFVSYSADIYNINFIVNFLFKFPLFTVWCVIHIHKYNNYMC